MTMTSCQVESDVLWAWPSSLNAAVVRRFFELFEKYGGFKSGKLKLKKPKQLQVEDLCLFLTIALFCLRIMTQSLKNNDAAT